MRVEANSIFNGLRGRLGNLVFKQVNGKTVVCQMPKKKKRKGKETASQMNQREKFVAAVAYAKEKISNPKTKLKYQKIAMKNNLHSAYNAAIKEFMGAERVK